MHRARNRTGPMSTILHPHHFPQPSSAFLPRGDVADTETERDHTLRIDTGRLATRFALLAGAAATVLGATTGTAVASPGGPIGAIVDSGATGAIGNSFIVVLQPGSPAAGVASASARLTRRYGGQVVDNYQATVRGFHARMTTAQAGRLAADPAVQYVEQDATVDLASTTTQPDPVWDLDRIDQRRL